jgi:hypothetical protein
MANKIQTEVLNTAIKPKKTGKRYRNDWKKTDGQET